MKSGELRIGRPPKEEWTDATREVNAFWGEPNAWEEGSATSIISYMSTHPPLGAAYNVWGKHLLMDNLIPLREREIIILRVAWLVRSQYEWHNHVGYGLNAGLTLEEIAAIGVGPGAESWNALERAILVAIDEQVQENRISDATWAALREYYDKPQMMDLVFTIGHYVMTSWAMASLDVPLEDGADIVGFDLKTQSGKIPGKTYKPGETEDWITSRGY